MYKDIKIIELKWCTRMCEKISTISLINHWKVCCVYYIQSDYQIGYNSHNCLLPIQAENYSKLYIDCIGHLSCSKGH